MTRWMVLFVLAAAATFGGATTVLGEENGRPAQLRCEYLSDPWGIDVTSPRLSWQLPPGPQGRKQGAYRVLVATSEAALKGGKGDAWDSGKVTSDQSVFVPYGGRPLRSGERLWWKVRVWDQDGKSLGWSEPGFWSMGLLQASDWTGSFVGLPRPSGVKEGTPLPFPWLRKTISLDSVPKAATAYVNSLGYFELYVNGKKVGDHVLEPTTSDFSRRSLYVTLNLDGYLKKGKNTLALWLGRGWYVRGHAGVVHDGPLVRAQFDLGGRAIATDGTWKVRESPLSPLGRGTAFGDYGGERYDPSKEVEGWNAVALDDSGWQNAAVFETPQVPAVAQMIEPNRLMETVRPVSVKEQSKGVYLLDMGKNMVGWLEFRLPSGLPAGKMVKLEYSDFPPVTQGRWITHNQRDEIITRGGARPQVFRSRFNYHGFQWVRVTGLEQAPTVADAVGTFITTDYAKAAEFQCDDEQLNRLHRMMTYTYRNLTLGGYVVDCPTRERLGYGGDAGTSLETGMFNFGTGGLYNRWLGDWRAAQNADGDLPYTAPHYQNQGGGGPMWSGFVVTLPWQLYLHYGDRRILETSYPSVTKWLAFLKSKTDSEGVLQFYESFAMRLREWNFLGDWVPPRVAGGVNPPFGDAGSAQLMNNLHYVYQLQLAAKMARLLGKASDAAAYNAAEKALAKALHARFYKPESRSYATGEQTYLVFPLFAGIVPPNVRGDVAQHLEKTIRVDDRGHINTGMHGTYFMLKYLMEQDRNDLIALMVRQKTFPGWGHMLAQGATTSWEDWEGNNSRIHDTLISLGSWFIQGIGGIRIDPESPGFKHFIIRPGVISGVTSARATYQSPYGRIVSDWKIVDGKMTLKIEVPSNSTATVQLPGGSGGVMHGPNGSKAILDPTRQLVGSGSYTLILPLERAR